MTDGFFPRGASVSRAWAPGRLDILGGVADYSGGRVLQLTLDCGVTVRATTTDDGLCRARSLASGLGELAEVRVDAEVAFGDPESLGELLRGDAGTGWAAYVLGPVAVLASESEIAPRGLRLEVTSDLPPGAGLSSSAALEIASLRAVAAALGVPLPRDRVPILAQTVEHVVAGAPCGLMDQIAVWEGQADALLPILCRPGSPEAPLPLPTGVHLVGFRSGVRHAVGGVAYRRARTAAFMGRRLLGVDGWLAAVRREVWDVRKHAMPHSLTGRAFLETARDHGDPVTTIDPAEDYPVRDAAGFPIEESVRVAAFADALANTPPDLEGAGTLLFASCAGYGALGLGSDETDHIVDLVRAGGPARGLYGARVSGGGSGGTVAVLADDRGLAALPELVRRYRASVSPTIGAGAGLTVGSGPGAAVRPVVTEVAD